MLFPPKNAGVDAACEQSIQSPSGFSGVQTPSIYLTPAGGANPVCLNAGNYFTPGLFSPIDTAYYTAPSTCAPASARFQTEQMPSFNGSRGEWAFTGRLSSKMESSMTPNFESSGVAMAE